MTTDAQALDALTPALLALPLDQVARPNMPVANLHQEAHELITLLQTPKIHARVAQNAKAKAALEALAAALPASRAAQARWIVARERGKPEAQHARERAGFDLRSHALRACDFFLADTPEANTSLDLIREGDGVEDLISDLDALAQLIERHADAFQDDALDVSDLIAQLRDHANLIRAGKADLAADTSATQSVDLRDRAASLVRQHTSTLRRFGRYAFAGDPILEPRFQSAHNRRRWQRQRARNAQTTDG